MGLAWPFCGTGLPCEVGASSLEGSQETLGVPAEKEGWSPPIPSGRSSNSALGALAFLWFVVVAAAAVIIILSIILILLLLLFLAAFP